MRAEECKHIIEANKAGRTQSLILFLKDGEFPRGKENVIAFHETKALKWKENGQNLIQASCFQEASNLRQLKSLHRSGIFFLLGLGNEPVQHYPITAYQRLGYLLTLTRERSAYRKIQAHRAEARQTLENLSTFLGKKDDYNPSVADPSQQIYYRPVNKGKMGTGI